MSEEIKESIFSGVDEDLLQVQYPSGDSGYDDELTDRSSETGVEKPVSDSSFAHREKAVQFVKDTMKKIQTYSSYLYDRIQADSEEVNLTPVIEKSRKRPKGFENDDDQPILFTEIGLRTHQIEGFKWLKTLYEHGLNGILADEMGLGKTAVSIAAISHLIAMGVDGPFLVCSPLSTVPNWCEEMNRFAPEVPYIMYHGNKEERKMKMSKILNPVRVRNVTCKPVVITSYDIVMADSKELKKFEWKYVVIDEGHRLKNSLCKFSRVLKTFDMTNCLILTGTPLQNNLAELWALLNVILPEIFNDLEGFRSMIDIVMLSSVDADQVVVSEEERNHLISSIHQILTPFMLRRTKNDISLPLPPKREILVYAPMTELQKMYYCSIIDKKIEEVLKGEKDLVLNNDNADESLTESKKRVLVKTEVHLPKRKRKKINYAEIGEEDFETENISSFDSNLQTKIESVSAIINLKTANTLMLLRKVCQHPYLLSFPLDPKSQLLIDEKLVKSSGKLMVLDAMLPELKRRGHKVLIFSQFVIMLDILVDYCLMRKFKFNMLTGRTKFEDRTKEIKAFNTSKCSFLFLLSTRAGGLGINLTSADTVIIFDSDWNPQCDLQAQDRCHRLGQDKPVVVYRFVTENTIDQKIIEKASTKRKLEKLVIKEGRFCTNDTLNKSQEPVPAEELLSLLHSSDIEASVRCNAKQVFTKEELDMLLDRSDLQSIETSQKLCKKEMKGVFKVIS